MGLNESKGNMYEWVTHTWNTVKGECYHNCVYCYMKTWGNLKPVRFDESELKTDLGSGNTIFVGNTNDMFNEKIPDEWIERTIQHCENYQNTYVLQSKNPHRIAQKRLILPTNVILGTTIETNRDTILISKAPTPQWRAKWIGKLAEEEKTFITIEPIMDFDLEPFAEMIANASPNFVNIGADSKRHNLHEPSYEKVIALVDELKKAGIEIRKKINLQRLMGNAST
jgi:DNA repair photolyase